MSSNPATDLKTKATGTKKSGCCRQHSEDNAQVVDSKSCHDHAHAAPADVASSCGCGSKHQHKATK